MKCCTPYVCRALFSSFQLSNPNAFFVLQVPTPQPTPVPTSVPTVRYPSCVALLILTPRPNTRHSFYRVFKNSAQMAPTPSPTQLPTPEPTPNPTLLPTHSLLPTPAPSPVPSLPPSPVPTNAPSPQPSQLPTPVGLSAAFSMPWRVCARCWCYIIHSDPSYVSVCSFRNPRQRPRPFLRR
jgi:hypothetical protein